MYINDTYMISIKVHQTVYGKRSQYFREKNN